MSRKPERTPLDHYLDRISRRLWLVPARERRDTREELRQHLERLVAHAARTVSTAEAMEDAMEKFGDPKQIGGELSRQHLRRRRWLSVLLKTAAGAALTLLIVIICYSAYWYFALSRPMEREPTPTPIASAAATLAAIQAAQDGYASQIQSVRFQSDQAIQTHNQGYADKYADETVPHSYQVASKGNKSYSRDVWESRYGDGPDQTHHVDDVYVSDGHTLRESLTEWNGATGSPYAKKTHSVRAYLRDDSFKPYSPNEAMQYGYKIGDTWIGDVLRQGKPLVEGAVTDAQFGPLIVVRCQNKMPWATEPVTVRLWLAPKFGWLAVKSEINIPKNGPNLPIRQTRETRAVAKAGPFWVTTEGNLQGDYTALGHRQQLVDRPVRFLNIALNGVPDSLFSVRYAIGTQLWRGWGDDTKLSILQPSGQWKEHPLLKQPLVNSPGIASLWPFALAGVIALVGIGFAMLRARRRGRGVA